MEQEKEVMHHCSAYRKSYKQNMFKEMLLIVSLVLLEVQETLVYINVPLRCTLTRNAGNDLL